MKGAAHEYAACALSAGSFQFWHVWNWFRN